MRRDDLPGVLFVSAYPPVDVGARAISEDLALRLAQRGWPVRLTSRRRSRALRPVDHAITIWASRKTYDVAVIDVYSGAAFRWAEWAAAALRHAGKPVILTLHGGDLPAFARRAPERVRRLLRAASAVTAPSSFLAEVARHVRDDVRIIPNAIEVDRYAFRLRAPAEPRLMWLRAMHAIYNPTLAVRVVARLVPEFPALTLTMTGPDKDGSAAHVRSLVERLGVHAHVRITGPVAKADVPNLLAEGDVFLNTTTVDNTPVSVIEAMACGLCVVSTNVGGIPHLLDDARDALLVPSDDEAAMAGAIRRVLTDDTLASRLSRAGRARAEHFGWDHVLAQWEQLLHEVADGGRAPAEMSSRA